MCAESDPGHVGMRCDSRVRFRHKPVLLKLGYECHRALKIDLLSIQVFLSISVDAVAYPIIGSIAEAVIHAYAISVCGIGC